MHVTALGFPQTERVAQRFNWVRQVPIPPCSASLLAARRTHLV
jgi:hypothetical protein